MAMIDLNGVRSAHPDEMRSAHLDEMRSAHLDDVPFEHVDFVSRALESIRGVLLRAKTIDLRAAEPDKSETAHESLLRTIGPLLDETLAIIHRVTERFEEDENDRERVDVADIAALAAMSLQQRRALLTHAQPCDHWMFLENCERSLRSLEKSAAVVESALARYDHLPARFNRAAELTTALAVRRRYATLRREISHATAAYSDLPQRLQSVSRSLATLLNCVEYPSMRLGDRRELRMLQFRLQSWLSAEPRIENAGERTWEEAVAVVMLIGGISRRSELASHDAVVLSDLVAAVAQADDARVVREAAEPLFGLDPELDQLLDIRSPEGFRPERWQAVVTRLANERGITLHSGPRQAAPVDPLHQSFE
jgi:hypothetical protein